MWRSTIPNIDGLTKASHFQAADARCAYAALVQMQTIHRLEGPFVALSQTALKNSAVQIIIKISFEMHFSFFFFWSDSI